MSKFLDNRGNYNARIPDVHYLDTNGDGTGDVNAVGNFAVTPTTFYYGPPTDKVYVAEKLIWHLADKGQFELDGFANITGGLTNGINIEFWRLGQLVLRLNNGEPIKTNASMTHVNTDYRKTTFANSYESASVSFDSASFGGPLYMVGDLQDQIRVSLSDDLTGLLDQHFILYGVA